MLEKFKTCTLPIVFLYNEKYYWNPEDKVKYSTKAFLKRTSQRLLSQMEQRMEIAGITYVEKRCLPFVRSQMGNIFIPYEPSVTKDTMKRKTLMLNWIGSRKRARSYTRVTLLTLLSLKELKPMGILTRMGMPKSRVYSLC